LGDWIFGCDVCQEVCPHNQATARSRERLQDVRPEYSPHRESLNVLDVLNWNDEARSAVFVKSSMKRAKLDMMKRNALIVAGNWLRDAENQVLQRRIEQIRSDTSESDLVRRTAESVIQRLRRSRTSAITASI
jgi:epoxyqueuosine reductase